MNPNPRPAYARYFVASLASVLLLGALAFLEPRSWADRINFHSGEAIDGVRITEISGDIIRYRKGFLHYYSTNRVRLTGRKDKVVTRQGNAFLGEIHYIDGVQIEIVTDTGRHVLLKSTVRDIELGSRSAASQYYGASASQAKASTSSETTVNPYAPQPQGTQWMDSSANSSYNDQEAESQKETSAASPFMGTWQEPPFKVPFEETRPLNNETPAYVAPAPSQSRIDPYDNPSASSSSASSSYVAPSRKPTDSSKPRVIFPGG